MKRFKVSIALLLVGVMLFGTTTMVSGATNTVLPYSSVSHGCKNYLNPIKDKAWGTIVYNNIRPVSNYLSVKLKVQYQNKNDFLWEPEMTDAGSDREKSEVVFWRYSIMGSMSYFEAKSAGCPDYSASFADTCR